MAFSPSFLVVLVISLPYKVFPQVVVEEGQTALLPCLYSRPDLPSEPTVSWTDPEERLLLKLSRGRVENLRPNVVLPEQQRSGSFSISIQKVSRQMTGIYKCYIREVDALNKIYLNVTERIQKTEVQPQGQKASPPAPQLESGTNMKSVKTRN